MRRRRPVKCRRDGLRDPRAAPRWWIGRCDRDQGAEAAGAAGDAPALVSRRCRVQRPADRCPVGRGPATDGQQGAAGARLPAARALGAESPIVTRPSGYAIRLDPGSLDLARFESRVAQARIAPSEEAAELLRQALSEFRGPPLADAPLYGPASSEADRLNELRLAALEHRVELDLNIGRNRELVSELEALTAEYPYRERFHAQLMLALYRAGRQADALEAYRRARHTLIEELGLEPSRELQRLEGAILAQDPALDLADAPAPA